jgi:predicted metal-dependent hydrolase
MDRLAGLAVRAVQCPDTAVQVYWLTCVCAAAAAESAAVLTLKALIQQALAASSLDSWARPLAPRALVQLLRQGELLEGSWAGHLPARQEVTWEALRPWHRAVVQVPQMYQPYMAELCEQADRLWSTARRLYGPRLPELTAWPEEIWRGAVLFDAGFYFACHEYFETLWGRVEDAASDLYQGLIQIAVAMRHLESHNMRGAIILLQYGLGRLQRYPAVYKGLALAPFVEHLTVLLRHLQALPDLTAYQFDAAQVPRLLGKGR